MKKICLVVVGLYLSLLSAFSQSRDSTQYKSRKLKIDEVNLVNSYYNQDGNNSGVTGGIGTEKLVDVANIIEVQLSRYDSLGRKQSFDLSLGVDHYSSASSDKIDPHTISSASSHDTRIYPAGSWSIENDKKRRTISFNASASHEFDYLSFGIGASVAKQSKDKNREFTVKAQAYLDQVTIILPLELRKGADTISSLHPRDDYPKAARNSFSASLSLSQIINKRFQVMFLTDLTYQQGFLGLPFYRVYFSDHSEKAELLPSTRFKFPIGARANYFVGNNIVIRSFYRFYVDDWGVTAHTFDLETAIKITPFFSISPFYRYYTQTAVNYFAPYEMHAPTDKYFTSDYDLSAFHSSFVGMGFRVAPPKGVLGNQHWSILELRYGHYMQSNTLNSNIISMNLKFK